MRLLCLDMGRQGIKKTMALRILHQGQDFSVASLAAFQVFIGDVEFKTEGAQLSEERARE